MKINLMALCLFTLFTMATVSLSASEVEVLKFSYKPGEITTHTDKEIKKLDDKITKILEVPQKEKNFENTIVAFDNIFSDFDDGTTKLSFMNYVSLDKSLREEAEKSEAKVSQYSVALMTRRDIYNAVVDAYKNTSKNKLNTVQKRLAEQTIKGFKRNGLFLPDAELMEVKKLQQQLAELTTKFQANINAANDTVDFTAEELKGVPQSFLDRLEKVSGGKFKVTTKSTDYVTVIENAMSSETRKKMLSAYENRAADTNTKILTQVIELRQKIAKALKYKTWADYKTEDRMAKNAKTATDFLNGLREKMFLRNKKDMDILLAFKKTLDPKATGLDPWDGRFLEYQIKKTKYSLDDEMIREYFPSDYVVEKMFEVYSKLLGIKFVPLKDAKVWAPNVHLYEIRNSSDDSFVAHFFTDFVPREGKYNHAAAFTLTTGRRLQDGSYDHPISAIVANFEPPANGKPSLLNHDQVETLFHEFGHIMHQTLTQSEYGSLAGSRVARDFVEAPSQMLENWVWSPEILKMISGHFKDQTKKLPDEIIKKLLETRNFNKGYFYTRQLLFGIFDMTLHTELKPVEDPTAIYKKLYKELTGINPLNETHFPAGFGHLMGYDAGYYGYLWSEVYADDMFTLFEKDGLLNSKVGMKYRKNILEKGDTAEAGVLLVNFLGRKPNNKAFFKRLLSTK